MHRNYLFPQIFVVTGEATAPPQSPHDAIDELVQQKPGEIDKNNYKMCESIKQTQLSFSCHCRDPQEYSKAPSVH